MITKFSGIFSKIAKILENFDLLTHPPGVKHYISRCKYTIISLKIVSSFVNHTWTSVSGIKIQMFQYAIQGCPNYSLEIVKKVDGDGWLGYHIPLSDVDLKVNLHFSVNSPLGATSSRTKASIWQTMMMALFMLRLGKSRQGLIKLN